MLLPGDEPLIAGATAKVDRGVVVSSSALLDEQPETWVTGDPLDWCETVIDPGAEKLQAGGVPSSPKRRSERSTSGCSATVLRKCCVATRRFYVADIDAVALN